jgi:hypothetical protein
MVKHVKIGGEERPVKYGFAALMEFTEANGYTMADLDTLGDNMKLKDALFLVWCGLKHGSRVEKKPFSYTIEDVADWLDEKPAAMEEVLNVFSSSFSASEEEKK